MSIDEIFTRTSVRSFSDKVPTDEDMELLKKGERIDNYGDSSYFPVFGGKLKGYSGKPGTEEV